MLSSDSIEVAIHLHHARLTEIVDESLTLFVCAESLTVEHKLNLILVGCHIEAILANILVITMLIVPFPLYWFLDRITRLERTLANVHTEVGDGVLHLVPIAFLLHVYTEIIFHT